jgi:carboxynorspermidine decarboxylase
MVARLTVETPALVYDEAVIDADCARVKSIADRAGCRLLYAVKALSLAGPLRVITRHVNGFACSSLFEAMLVRRVIGDDCAIHLTAPGLRPEEVADLSRLCHSVNFNSMSQFERLACQFPGAQTGIRVNPMLSLVSDRRYDPCRPHSKLGALPEEIRARHDGIAGLLFHNNCDAEDFQGLHLTIQQLASELRFVLPGLRYVNLGGGLLFRPDRSVEPFIEAVAHLRGHGNFEILVEPGAALVRRGVKLIASVVDLFERSGRTVAVLDTSINHIPEVFEYQDLTEGEPWVEGHIDGAPHAYLLAGATCLAGDLFGEYEFEDPLQIGDQIVFPEQGAYSFVKAHRFNGVNLPNIYSISPNGELTLQHRFTFSDFATHNLA